MKKFIILLLGVLLLSSCEAPDARTSIDKAEMIYIEGTETHSGAYYNWVYFTHNGHKWISIDGTNCIHDPDCPCLKKKTTSSYSIFD